MREEGFIVRLLSKLNTLSTEVLLGLFLCFVVVCISFTIIGGMAVSRFAPPDPNPPPHTSPAMEALRRELRYCSNPEMQKFYAQKIMELEERENSRKQILLQIAPVASNQ